MPLRFLFWILLILLIAADPLRAEPPKVTSGEALEKALTKMGYVGIPLEREKSGHLIAKLQV